MNKQILPEQGFIFCY